MDEMWSLCHDKSRQVWLWWAIDHETNTPLAYVFGTREHKYLDELLKLLESYSIKTVYADNNYAYKDKISENRLITGKKDTQQIERDHLTFRTRIKRLARKTICFSKTKPPPAKSRWVWWAAKSRLKVAYVKVIVLLRLFYILRLYILEYDIICHISAACSKIFSRPQMSSPILLI